MAEQDHILATLLSNESFIRWIKGHSGILERRRWEEWENQDPTYSEIKKKAQLIYEIPLNEGDSSDLEFQIDKLNKRIDNSKSGSRFARSKKSYRLAAAAVIALLLGVISFLMYNFKYSNDSSPKASGYKIVQVSYGESALLKQSDGSVIHLNSNSTLRYKPDQLGSKKVEVWLKGEGYFSIVHNPGNKKRAFIVHTADGDIYDLGTEFNVNTNLNHTSVVLEEGRVQLKLRGSQNRTEMSPGQQAILESSKTTIPIKKVDTSLYTAWLNGRLKFDSTSLQEIIQKVENTYGVTIETKAPDLLGERISGSLRNPDLETLIAGLEAALDINFKKINEDEFLISGQR